MAEYIEREAAISTACKGCNKEFADMPCEPCDCSIQQGLFAIPTADVAEVVRCKDCRNFGEDVGMSKDGVWARCFLHKRIMCEKDFCSYGEKMDGKGEG